MSRPCAFEPKHTTFVAYPARFLVQSANGQEINLMFPVSQASSRYDPTDPLINDEEVVRNTSLNTNQPWQMMTPSYTRATKDVDDFELPEECSNAFDAYQLIEHMNTISKYNGRTFLYCCTYQTAAGQDKARFERSTVFAFAGRRQTHKSTYDMVLEDLGVLAHADHKGQTWFHDLRDLITRRTDFAFLAVQKTLRAQSMVVEKPNWKTARKPDYQQILQTMVVNHETSLEDDSDDCGVCWSSLMPQKDELVEESHIPDDVVQLPCGRHRFHRSCLQQVYEAEGPKARDPHCRTIVSTPAHIDLLVFGVTDGKEYLDDDSRWNSFEHFERSCADIDRYHAFEVNDRIVVNRSLFEEIFVLLVDGALKEDESSTPYRHQILRSVDFSIFREAIASTAKLLDGRSVKESVLHEAIMSDLKVRTVIAFAKGGLIPTLNDHEMSRWTASPEKAADEALSLRFMAEVSKLTNPLLEFVRLRSCGCDPRCHFHRHGLRTYYNPQA